MAKKQLGVIFGSRTCEHEVSIISGVQLARAADREKYDVWPIYIAKDGRWYTGEKLLDIHTYTPFDPYAKGLTRVTLDLTAGSGALISYEQEKGLFTKGVVPVTVTKLDCVIPVMHGLHGEDGTLQGLLELANIPYSSTGVAGSAIGMDKIAMKQILRGAGFPVLDFVWFTREQLKKERQAVIERVEKEIKYPAFIKPAALGSSIGVSRARNREELERALDVAASYDRRILVEVGVVHPVEINCAAVGYGEDVRASVCEMPVPSSNDTFLDFWQKYLRNASTKGEDSRGMKSLSRVVPAPIGDELTGRIQTMTCDIFKLLDCCGTVRVDFILDQNDMLFVNEPNTIPGSLAFYLWKASGLDFPKLIEKMVEDALRAHADKNSSVFAYDSSILKKVAAGTKGSKR